MWNRIPAWYAHAPSDLVAGPITAQPASPRPVLPARPCSARHSLPGMGAARDTAARLARSGNAPQKTRGGVTSGVSALVGRHSWPLACRHSWPAVCRHSRPAACWHSWLVVCRHVQPWSTLPCPVHGRVGLRCRPAKADDSDSDTDQRLGSATRISGSDQ